MSHEALSTTADFADAIAATRAVAARQARLRLALWMFFGAMSLAGLAVVADVVATRGAAAVVEAWPALAAQLGGVAVLVALLRRQWRRVRGYRRTALPVREAVRDSLADVAAQRRESAALLMLAAAAVPALLVAVQRVAATGALDAAASRWLSLACVIPGLVIAAVHGTRYRRLRGELEALGRLASDLDRV